MSLISGFGFLVRSPKHGELLSLEWGMILQLSNIIFPDENSDVNIPKNRINYNALLDTKEVGNSLNSLLDHAWWWVSISKYFILGRVSLLSF